MALENQSYPKIPAKMWWMLRRKFHQSLPKDVNIKYLAITYELENSSAKTYLRHLKTLGLVTDDGKTTDRANKWRGEQGRYEEACREMIEEVYPDELNDLISDVHADRDKATRWFMDTMRVGQGAARHMAATYLLIREADLSKENENTTPKPRSDAKDKPQSISATRIKSAAKPAVTASASSQQAKSEQLGEMGPPNFGFQPKIHIDVQIHISPESSAEQIEQIFASMAKHLSGSSNK